LVANGAEGRINLATTIVTIGKRMATDRKIRIGM
jgi:hypothetical protein